MPTIDLDALLKEQEAGGNLELEDLFNRLHELKTKREKWAATQTPAARDLALKEKKLAKLDAELKKIQEELIDRRGDHGIPEDGDQQRNASIPVPLSKIIAAFPLHTDSSISQKLWVSRTGTCTRDHKKLAACRAQKGAPGRGAQSRWHPDQIAAYLVENKGYTASRAAQILKKEFSDCPFCQDFAADLLDD